MNRVLVAQPVRASESSTFLVLSGEAIAAQDYPDMEHVVWPNTFSSLPGAPKYDAHARARNAFVEQFVTEAHTYVWWVDADIVEIPRDTLSRLVAIAEDFEQHAIVAPAVHVEMIKPGPVSIDNGGWFYDIGGFTIGNGQWISQWEGLNKMDGQAEMHSVGCCSLVPAWLYGQGLRYEPTGHEVEHVSLCRAARDRYGVRSIAVKEIQVKHAYLPQYGERWH